jgi:hypothetical protein
MKKLGLLVALSIMTVVCTSAAFSQASAPSGDNKMKNAAKAVGNGIMWGPRKVGAGFKALGSKMHHGNKSSSSK